MSALALVLMAGMAVPGDMPGAVSAEMEQGLSFVGTWEGRCWTIRGDVWRVETSAGNLTVHAPDGRLAFPWKFTDEGGGRVRVQFSHDQPMLGIYKRVCDQVVICYAAVGKSRPTSFQAGGDQELLILRRVRPRK